MAKMPKPLPVIVTKFVAGEPEVAVVQPLPDYKKRLLGVPVPKKDEWMPDEIRCDRRIMGKQLKGGTTVLGYAHKWNVEEKVAKFEAERRDLSEVYVEVLPDEPLSDEEKAVKELRERRMQAAYPKVTRASNGVMTDEHARRVKFGDLANVKVSEAAKLLGLSYGQVYSAKNGYTFRHVTK